MILYRRDGQWVHWGCTKDYCHECQKPFSCWRTLKFLEDYYSKFVKMTQGFYQVNML